MGSESSKLRTPNPKLRRATGVPPARPVRPEVSFEEKPGGKATAASCSTRITSVEQLLAATAVDLSVWEVERHVINKWEVAMKEEAETGRVRAVVEPLFQIKLWLRRKAPQLVGLRGAVADLLATLERRAAPPRPIRYQKHTGSAEQILAEIDIFDHHFGKLCWAAESGEDYDVKHAEALFMEAIARHCDSAVSFGVTKFLFVIGNDFLNVDNAAGTTTAGTPQQEDGRWQRTYTRGFALLERGIEYLRRKAPVDVVQVPGNHDFERGFYLAHALQAVYRNQPDVSIDNRPTVRKYYRWGNTLLGFTHGDKELEKDLPLTMAIEAPKLWAETKYREFHCGHVHHKRKKVYQPVLEQKGVVVRHLSALTAADAWHAGKGYRSQRASSCFIHHAKHGVIAELSFNL